MRVFTRYVLVGLVTNGSGYLVFLLLTWLNVNPKIAMSALYFVGAFLGYWGNRQFTFLYQGGVLSSSARYCIAHILGYGLNLSMLIFFSDVLGYAYQWVQLVAIFIVALFLFLMSKFFVFPNIKQSLG
ncbi:MAG: GtrA family protein [Pseudomonadales bacterium]|nr:GtrA family protein [Pseudomonadales bacterium]